MTQETKCNLHDQPIFIISPGRSGSTWLQNIVNVHPDIVIWGEHAGFLKQIAASYDVVMKSPYIKDKDSKNTVKKFLIDGYYREDLNPVWINSFTKESFHKIYKKLFLQIFASPLSKDQRWGFKDITYSDHKILGYLYKMFPDSQFIFLERDIVSVCKSQIKTFYKDIWDEFDNEETQILIIRVITELRHQQNEIAIFKKEVDKSKYIDIKYEQLVTNFELEVDKVFDFIGYDVQDHIKTLEQAKHQKIHPTNEDRNLCELITDTINNHELEIQENIDNFGKIKEMDQFRFDKQRRKILDLEYVLCEQENNEIKLIKDLEQSNKVIKMEAVLTKELEKLKEETVNMKKSKFWKLRHQYINIKSKIGLK